MQSFKSKLFQNENNMRDVKDILDEAQESMDMAIMYLDEALAHIRAGKADIRLLDGIRVDSYNLLKFVMIKSPLFSPSSGIPRHLFRLTTVIIVSRGIKIPSTLG